MYNTVYMQVDIFYVLEWIYDKRKLFVTHWNYEIVGSANKKIICALIIYLLLRISQQIRKNGGLEI